LYQIANLERGLGKLAQARSRIEVALETIETLRTRVNREDLRTSYFASVRQYYDFYITLLMQLHARNPAAEFDVAAFEASEKARARTLLETLASARIGVLRKVDPVLRDREQSLRDEINSKATYKMLVLEARHSPEEIAAVDKEINDLIGQQRELEM